MYLQNTQISVVVSGWGIMLVERVLHMDDIPFCFIFAIIKFCFSDRKEAHGIGVVRGVSDPLFPRGSSLAPSDHRTVTR